MVRDSDQPTACADIDLLDLAASHNVAASALQDFFKSIHAAQRLAKYAQILGAYLTAKAQAYIVLYLLSCQFQ
ncbi:hypothetical protein D9M68_919740 [compost metagenome]